MGYKVFISYSTDDMNLVNELTNNFRKMGIEVYVAGYYPELGESLPNKIERNIDSSDAMVVLLTRMGARSAWVQQEIGFAKAKNKLIIPLVDEGEKIKGFIMDKEYLKINPENIQETIDKLLPKINKLKTQKETNQVLLWGGIAIFAVWLLTRD